MSRNKRGFVGIGTMLVFIAVILVAAIGAGVVIRTGMSLQNKALQTGTIAKGQVSSGVEIMSVNGYVNTSEGLVYGYEVGLRVLPSSDSLNPEEMVMRYTSRSTRLEALYSNITGCSFANVTLDTEWCLSEQIGDGDRFLDENELWRLFYHVSQPDNAAIADTQIELRFIVKQGMVTSQKMPVPNYLRDQLIGLYP